MQPQSSLADQLRQLNEESLRPGSFPVMQQVDSSAWAERLKRLQHVLGQPHLDDWRQIYRVDRGTAEALSSSVDLLEWVCNEAAYRVVLSMWQVYIERATVHPEESQYLRQATLVDGGADSLPDVRAILSAPSQETGRQLLSALVAQTAGAWRERLLLWEHLISLTLGDLAKYIGDPSWVPQLEAEAVARYVCSQAPEAVVAVVKTHGARLADQVTAKLVARDIPLVQLRNALIGMRRNLGDAYGVERNGSSNHFPLACASALPHGYLAVLNHQVFHSLRGIIAQRAFADTEYSPWPTARLASDTGHVELRPLEYDQQLGWINTGLPSTEAGPHAALIHKMWQQRAAFSDLDADVLDLLSALWIQQAFSPSCDAVADVDQLLALRGLQQKLGGQGRRGGYEPEQREAMVSAVSRVQNLWIRLAEKAVHVEGATQRQVRQSRAFVVSDYEGWLSGDGEITVRRFLFRPGSLLARFLLGPGRQIALLSAQALRYNPHNCFWEKRLTRQFSWLWGIRAEQHGSGSQHKVGALLESVGMNPQSRMPLRTRERFEAALDRLQLDGVIAGWQYEKWDETKLPRRGWLSHWLRASLIVEPPDEVQQYYMDRWTNGEGQRGDVQSTFGEDIRRHRLRIGMTQLQAAEQLGVHQAHLSRMERNEARPSESLQQKARAWMQGDTGE